MQITKINCRIIGLALAIGVNAFNLVAQRPSTRGKQAPEPSSEVWFYVTVAAALISLGVVFYFWQKSRNAIEETHGGSGSSTNNYNSENYESDVDAEKELEWLRKAKKSASSRSKMIYELKKAEPSKQRAASPKPTGASEGNGADTRAFQEKMKMLHYAQLPINAFSELVPIRNFEMLLDSDARTLTDAIDQTIEELQPDEKKREAAIKILAAFRTSNSFEALSQVALYDISSSLRSKAVTVLTDFDHETVFETILLACADPTREVRAAAARGLFRLNFDRSGAWKRIIETEDEFRMSQAVRAASEAGIVTKSFDRLVHEDMKIAYEAFTLVALLIRSGENDEIFTTLRDHKDERVKYALLHVLKAIKAESSFAGLNDLLENGACSADVKGRIDDVIATLKGVAAHSHA